MEARKINSYLCPEWIVGEDGLTLIDFIGWLSGAFISVSWYLTKNWVLNNDKLKLMEVTNEQSTS